MAQSFTLGEERRLVSSVTTRHSTNKGCPRSPRRDTTERNKAELSPWTLSGAASALAGRPRTARRKAIRNAGAKALRMGQRDESTSCQAAGATVALAPLSAWTRLVLQTNKEAHASKYSPHGRTTPSGMLSHPPGWRSGASGGCAALTDHIKGKIAESPFGRIHRLDQSLGGYCRVPQLGTP